jgi:hypothetical protein
VSLFKEDYRKTLLEIEMPVIACISEPEEKNVFALTI